MKTNSFHFKKFSITQNHAAMKVGTDGVLLGAWTNCENAKSMLDIGTGTGLIALMLAQRTEAKIDAIDINESAVKDAFHNISASPWSSRLQVRQASLQDFSISSENKYDGIVCNPPFFNNSLQSPLQNRTVARHTSELSFDDLLHGVSKLLFENGLFSVILPRESEVIFYNNAEKYGLFPSRIVAVKPNLNKEPKRVLMEFSFQKIETKREILTLEREMRHQYTNEFTQLVKDFYLKL